MNSRNKWDIILAGNTGAGKTAMIVRYIKDSFNVSSSSTVAVDFFSKRIKIHEKDIILNIWDTAGQEQFHSITPMYFRKADGCILVYDVKDVLAFNSLYTWLSKFRNLNDSAPVIIVGNKIEDQNKKTDVQNEVEYRAGLENIDFMECSAKTGTNVESVFESLIEKIRVNKIALAEDDLNSYQKLEEIPNVKKKKKCC